MKRYSDENKAVKNETQTVRPNTINLNGHRENGIHSKPEKSDLVNLQDEEDKLF